MSTPSGSKGCVLVVDDEPLKRITLQLELTEAGYTVFDAAEPAEALRLVQTKPVDIVVTDLRLPGMDGIGLLERVKQYRPDAYVILMTAYATVDTAVEAMKRGAYDYITKPFRTDALLEKLERIRAHRAGSSQHEGAGIDSIGRLIGRSHAMRHLFEQIRTIADSERTILICGASGTGKELVAEAIHQHSRRRDKPLIKLSCAALQPTVLESELFGHERGAFTGAIRQKAGRFELADGGTLFLDDVDDIPSDLQVKLLRVIEQQEFERVGGEHPIHVDVRLICATKKDLCGLVESGRFREDLYYRLNVICLTIPPLRDRREDIPVLVEHFIKKHCSLRGSRSGPPPTVSPHALDALMAYHWPGNVRELEHVIERALAFCDGEQIGREHLPTLNQASSTAFASSLPAEIRMSLPDTVADVERRMIESALRQANGNQARAAQILKIPRTTLRDKIAKYNLNGSVAQEQESERDGNPSS